MPIAVPRSLGKYPMTTTPFYLVLYAMESYNKNPQQAQTGDIVTGKWRGWTRGEIIAKAEWQFVLPLPEKTLGALTALKFSESANRWQSYNKGDVVEERLKALGIEAAESIAGQGVAELVEAYLIKGFGDASVPMDYTAISVFGTQKRSYRLSLELFSAENEDASDINNFCRLMHGLSTVVPTGDDILKTPAIFAFEVIADAFGSQTEVTKLWFPDPLPCAMISFNNTPTDFIQTFDGKSSARQIITMDLTEIEPVAYSRSQNAFIPTWMNVNE
jgi:hypothetical protein